MSLEPSLRVLQVALEAMVELVTLPSLLRLRTIVAGAPLSLLLFLGHRPALLLVMLLELLVVPFLIAMLMQLLMQLVVLLVVLEAVMKVMVLLLLLLLLLLLTTTTMMNTMRMRMKLLKVMRLLWMMPRW
jgi:hypothetical protein